MNLLNILENIGLTEKESKVYLTLLELHEALPGTIAKKAKVKRPTTYVILEQLQKRGLVSFVKKGRFLYFHSLDPKQLLEDQYNKYRSLEKALPELVNLNQKYTTTPQMTVYEGKEGLMKIMEDTLTTKTEILCWANVEEAVDSLTKDYYYHSYITKKVTRKIWVRGICCYGKTALRFKKFGNQELREIYLIPKEKFPFKNEINIYDDKVAIVSHEDQIGIIIQNQNIANTQRSIFKLGFEYAKILEKDILTKEDLEYLA